MTRTLLVKVSHIDPDMDPQELVDQVDRRLNGFVFGGRTVSVDLVTVCPECGWLGYGTPEDTQSCGCCGRDLVVGSAERTCDSCGDVIEGTIYMQHGRELCRYCTRPVLTQPAGVAS